MDFSRYTKYFNYGYFLSKYEPKILKKLLDATESASDVHEPLKAGKSQFQVEKLKKRIKSPNKPRKSKAKEKGREPEI